MLAVVAIGMADAGGAGLSAPPASALAVPSTLAPTAPSTLAPTAPPTISLATRPPSSTVVSSPTVSSSTTLPTSPLAALVGAAESALPTAPTVPTPPTRLSIGVIGVDVGIRAVGVQPDGQLEIPDETEVGWYGLGSAPGAPGTTVFAAHVNWHGRPGPFLRLSELEPGAEVIVTSADGTSRTYSVTERAQYPKASLPTERVWNRSGPETLVLITCGGDFDATQRRFRDNVVVYAVPIATAAAGS